MKITLKRSLLFVHIILLSLSAFCQRQTKKVETLITNFPANGYVNVVNENSIFISEYGVFKGTGGSGTRVFEISKTGKVLDSTTGLNGPIGTLADKFGNFYINNNNDTKKSIILKIDNSGKKTNFAEIKGWPIAMKSDKDSNIFFTNYNSPEIYKMNVKGEISVFVKNKEFIGTAGADFDSKGNLVVANFATAKIFSINPKGKVKFIAQIKDVVVKNWGIGYITIVDDFIYATAIAKSKIFKVSMDGNVEWFAGNGKPESRDGNLLEASLNYPNGIASDKKNKILYISEYGKNGGIRKIKL